MSGWSLWMDVGVTFVCPLGLEYRHNSRCASFCGAGLFRAIQLRRKPDLNLEMLQKGTVHPDNLIHWLSEANDRANSLSMTDLDNSLAHWRLRTWSMFAAAEEPAVVFSALCIAMPPRVGGVNSAILQADRVLLNTYQQLAGSKQNRSAKFPAQSHHRPSGLTAPQPSMGFSNIASSPGYGNSPPRPGPGSDSSGQFAFAGKSGA